MLLEPKKLDVFWPRCQKAIDSETRPRWKGGGEVKSWLSMLCVNVCGLRNREAEIVDSIERGTCREDDFVAVLETHYHTGERPGPVEGYEWFGAEKEVLPQRKSRDGVGVWVRKGLDVEVMDKNERVIWLRVAGSGGANLYVAFAYAPVQGTDVKQVRRFWQQLSERATELGSKGDVVVMGDLNGHVGEGGRGSNSNGKEILEFCRVHEMEVLNQEWAPHEFTWSAGERKTVVDYVLVQGKVKQKVKQMEVCGEEWSTDHRALRLKWKMGNPAMNKPSTRRKKRWRMPKNEEGWSKFAVAAEEKMSSWIRSELPLIEKEAKQTRVERLWRSWKAMLVQAADSALGKVKGGKRNMKGWDEEAAGWLKRRRRMYDEIQAAAAQEKNATEPREEAESKEMFERLVTMKREFKMYRRQLVGRLRKKQRSREQHEFEQLEEIQESQPKRFFSKIKEMRGASKKNELPSRMMDGGRVTTSDEETTRAWYNFFNTMGSPPATSEMFDDEFRRKVEEKVAVAERTGAPARVTGSEELAAEINEKEIERVMKAVAGGKAAGPDGIVNEFVTKGGPRVKNSLLLLFQEVWRAGWVPEEWLLAHVVPIYKKSGSRKEMSNYRPISLMSVVAKMYEAVVCHRITEQVEAKGGIGEEQGGFRKGRGCMDQVFALKEIMAQRKEQGKHTFMCFLDLSKAYDLTWRAGIFERLLAVGIHGKIWSVVKDMYRRVRSRVLVNGTPTEQITSNIGVRQGSALSPILFSIFISGVVEAWKAKGIGVSIGGNKVAGLLFADDIVLLAENEREMHTALVVMEEHASKWRYRFNIGKCAVMVAGKAKPTKEKWRLQGQAVSETKEYKYLGVVIQSSGSWQKWNNLRKAKGKRCLPTMWWCGARQGGLSLKTGRKLMEMMLWPAMAYGGELAKLSSNQAKSVEVVQNTAGRQVLGVSRVAASEMVRGELGWLTVENRRSISQLNFFHRLQCMMPSRLTAAIFTDRMEAELRCDGDKHTVGFCADVRMLLARLGRPDLFAIHTKWTKVEWSQLIRELVTASQVEQWMSSLGGSSGGSWYLSVKARWGMEQYLVCGGRSRVQQRGRQARSQFRLLVAPLQTNIHRFNHHHPTTCPHCRAPVEDETHAMMECPRYGMAREKMMAVVGSASAMPVSAREKAVWLLGHQDNAISMALHAFLHEVLALKQKDGFGAAYSARSSRRAR